MFNKPTNSLVLSSLGRIAVLGAYNLSPVEDLSVSDCDGITLEEVIAISSRDAFSLEGVYAMVSYGDFRLLKENMPDDIFPSRPGALLRIADGLKSARIAVEAKDIIFPVDVYSEGIVMGWQKWNENFIVCIYSRQAKEIDMVLVQLSYELYQFLEELTGKSINLVAPSLVD